MLQEIATSKKWVDQFKSSVPTTCVSAQAANPRVFEGYHILTCYGTASFTAKKK